MRKGRARLNTHVLATYSVLQLHSLAPMDAYSPDTSSNLNAIGMFTTMRPVCRALLPTLLLTALASQAALATSPEERDGAIADLRTICGDDDSAEKVAVPKELAPFVKPGTIPVEWHKVDLNLDGRPDYFLVVERACDERTLLLVTRNADGSLSLAAARSDLITCRSCNGQYDGYTGAQVGPGKFTIAQESGSAAGGSSEKFTLSWSKKKQTWVVTADEHNDCDRDTGCEGGIDTAAIGLPLEQFTAHLMTQGS